MFALLIFGWELALVIVGPVFGCCLAWRRGSRKTAGVIAILGGLLWAAVYAPSYPKARPIAQRHACIANLRQINEAKRSWSRATSQPANAIPNPADLAAFLKGSILPVCPASGTYTFGAVSELPRCSLHDQGHALEAAPPKASP